MLSFRDLCNRAGVLQYLHNTSFLVLYKTHPLRSMHYHSLKIMSVRGEPKISLHVNLTHLSFREWRNRAFLLLCLRNTPFLVLHKTLLLRSMHYHALKIMSVCGESKISLRVNLTHL